MVWDRWCVGRDRLIMSKNNSKKILNNNNNNNTPTKLNALLDGSSRSRSRTPFLNFPIWNWFAQIYFFPRDLVLFLFFGVRAQNYVRSKELTVATVVVEYTATNIAARELSRVNTNAIGPVVHVVEHCNDPNAIGSVVCVVKNIENPARPKLPLLMDAPNAFIFLCSCDFFVIIKYSNLIGTNVNWLWVWICSGVPWS